MKIRNNRRMKILAATLCLLLVGVVAAQVLSNYRTMFITVTDADFELSVIGENQTLWVGQTVTVTLTLTAPNTDGYSGTFNFTVSAGDSSQVLIDGDPMTSGYSIPFVIPIGVSSIVQDFDIEIELAGLYQILIFAHVSSV